MKKVILFFIVAITLTINLCAATSLKSLTSKYQLHKGFIATIFDEEKGKLYLKVNRNRDEFIYQTSLPQGLGSNDIGLDRGQLSDARLVEFERSGNKLLLIQKNTAYRAVSDNPNEGKSVEDAFASSVLWGFPIIESHKNWLLVDASDFILQDVHGVSRRLAALKQGNFKLDKSRSAIYLPRTKSFPDNTELEARITFTGNNPGKYVKQAAINPNIISLRMHHSFVRLPKPGYKARVFNPKSGYFPFEYEDYAQPVNQPITQRFIPRHRLEKKDPNAAISEAVKPIIYYLDSGAPEPVKTALLTGASWWDQAFQSIGFKNAFQVKVLPDDADPMDVRYNVIQWVHRATRGWSYGNAVSDPRTGEIIKGHVSLGSLRVRQDYLIAQGMLSRFSASQSDDHELMDLALARIRQLAAHEVGHTLGLAHNFAASTYGRASVMDYPQPLFKIEKNGASSKITSKDAYAENIGIWDKAAIAYGYSVFQPENEKAELQKILKDNEKKEFLFVSDPDSRKISNANPKASLWDNGENTVEELRRVLELRKLALTKFGAASLNSGRPQSDLEEILVPVYLYHRYQATAAAKWIGGYQYGYSVKESNQLKTVDVSDPKIQQEALELLTETLSPEFLAIDKRVVASVLPKAYGYRRDRESAYGATGNLFDPNALAKASIQHTLSLMLEPMRLARLQQQNLSGQNKLSIKSLTKALHQKINHENYEGMERLNYQSVVELIYSNYLNLIHDQRVSNSVKSEIFAALLSERKFLKNRLEKISKNSPNYGFYSLQYSRIKNLEITTKKVNELIALPKMPPGSPI